MMRRARITFLTCFLLLGLPLSAWSPGQDNSRPGISPAGANHPATDLQIRSPVLSVEFDRKLHPRVVPLVDGAAKPIIPFSASETVTGAKRTWSDFVLASSHREPVT